MTAGRWRVEVDTAVCVGSGMCAGHAPHVFALDPTRRSHPLTPHTDPAPDVLTAAEHCPVEAIRLTRAETGEPVFPPEE
ncbi:MULTISPECIES: ferredoxin [Streptomycetaceae]|uniref:ferredoxin n=1 Tax=Streptomycetaceae TaxID=2062 RepID=UPI000213E583|nr:ferredoxin [Streptantibioticus cattleyicolor]MYS58476.1 ferredoxin [Streptomyces sp. SID5468]CCB74136.1 Ferredoxin [Streptantibioticus cattleyicolor NRRL 8057 = DSM 46488]